MEVKNLENKINKTERELDILTQKKTNLQEVRKSKIEGIILRSRARWASQGEKVTKYYCNLEKRHYVSKQMFKLTDKEGKTITDTDSMLKETRQFYRDLYTKKDLPDFSLDTYVTLPTLEEDEAQSLEGLIDIKEASTVLKNMKNGKSPGSDGFTVDFFKFFWNKIGHFVVKSLNDGFHNKKMSITQREGIIICIPKGEKPREFLKNWRPISLLNVVYKIGSACIANRIKKTLPKLINEDQTGFVQGRYIGDNIRLIYDMIHYLEKENKPGLLVSIDFEKAFDSIDWNFMFKVLKRYGFGNDLIQWISSFYNDIKSSVIVNGKISQSFSVERGCRQGDPISPYLFILCAEVLACKIREDEEIKAIRIGNIDYKISQFADDTNFLLNGDRHSFEKLFLQLDRFANISGLKLNHEKTVNVWLGSKTNSQTIFLPHLNMTWNPPKYKILGLWFTNNLENMIELNLNDKFYEIKTLFNTWLKRTSTPIGRSVILKSLILSKLIYLWILLPNPPQNLITNLQKEIFEFIWDKKRDKIKRSMSIKHFKEGGLNIPDIKTYIQALKLTWLKKIHKENPPKWVHILQTESSDDLNFDQNGPATYTKKNLNPFWTNVFEAYDNLNYNAHPETPQEILAEPIFNNGKFKIGNQMINLNDWRVREINQVKHLVKEDGSFLTLQEFEQKYNFTPRPLQFLGCIRTVKKYIKTKNIKLENNETQVSSKLNALVIDGPRGSKHIYNAFINFKNIPTAWKNWEILIEKTVDWKKVCFLMNKIKETKLKWFQIKIIHRILVTNSILSSMGIKPNNHCNFCMQERDTVLHYLYKCVHVQSFWNEFIEMLKDLCPHCERLTLNPSLIIFGREENTLTDECFDFILMHAKFFIYKCRLNNNRPRIEQFKTELRYIYSIDKYVHSIEMSKDKFNRKWLLYKRLIE